MKVGFIGQGFIGSAYAEDFEDRYFETIRYSNEAPHNANQEKIKEADVVFIAVPTPSTPGGFDYSIVEEVVGLVGKGKVAVIKSTILPGTTEKIQEKYPDVFVMHSPEFLRAATAKEDAKHPDRNIIGYTDKKGAKEKAREVLDIVPPAPYNKIIPIREAELIKYMGNVFLAQKVLFANIVFDSAESLGIDYETVKDAVGNDPRIGMGHLDVSHFGGRGAGGFCFIKDLKAFSEFYEKTVADDATGQSILKSMEQKNIELLKNSNKDLDLLRGVYGDKVDEV
jgi:UDPglucose 6-dehydrogenase